MIDAKEYGKAIFLLSEEDGKTENAMRDILLVKDAMHENPTYETLLDTPALPVETKLGLIDEAFAEIDANVKNLLKILCEKHATHDMPKVAEVFTALYDESRGNLRVQAITAISMSREQLDAMTKKLELQTGKHIFIENIVDASILGGVTLRYAGVQLDGSVKTRLETLEKSLKGLVI